MKKCTKCNIEKETAEFHRDKSRRDGFRDICKQCVAEYAVNRYGGVREKKIVQALKWSQTNKEKRIVHRKRWVDKNPEKVKVTCKRYRVKHPDYFKTPQGELNRKLYTINNKDKISAYKTIWAREKRAVSPEYRVKARMSASIRGCLKQGKNNVTWEKLVGYTKQDLLVRLSKTMPEGFTWEDFMDGKLHIDHIIPVSAFNITDEKCIDFKRCWALTNLRMFPAHDNLVKWAHLSRPFQPSLAMEA